MEHGRGIVVADPPRPDPPRHRRARRRRGFVPTAIGGGARKAPWTGAWAWLRPRKACRSDGRQGARACPPPVPAHDPGQTRAHRTRCHPPGKGSRTRSSVLDSMLSCCLTVRERQSGGSDEPSMACRRIGTGRQCRRRGRYRRAPAGAGAAAFAPSGPRRGSAERPAPHPPLLGNRVRGGTARRRPRSCGTPRRRGRRARQPRPSMNGALWGGRNRGAWPGQGGGQDLEPSGNRRDVPIFRPARCLRLGNNLSPTH